MADTIRQTEGRPTSYPTVAGLSTDAAALDPEFLWRRIEQHVAHRWTPRTVTWVIQGSGDWIAPLWPYVITRVLVENGVSEWEEVPFNPASLTFGSGYGGARLWMVDATVGAGDAPLPGDVAEAFRRLAEYVAGPDAIGVPGASRYTIDLGRVSETISRREDHMARALINSGAADLLRPYRRPW